MLTLEKAGHRELDKYYRLFNVDFDSEELISRLELHKAMLKGRVEFFLVKESETGSALAYALTVTKGVYGYVLLKYFAVLPWVRGQGYGIETMRLLNKHYKDKQGLIAEITDFPDEDPYHQTRLFRFFERFGYRRADSDYKISGTAAHIMIKPLKGTDELEPVLHRLIRDLYYNAFDYDTVSRMIKINPLNK